MGDVQQEAGKGRPGNLDRNVQFRNLKLLSFSKQVLEEDQGQELLQLSKIFCDCEIGNMPFPSVLWSTEP